MTGEHKDGDTSNGQSPGIVGVDRKVRPLVMYCPYCGSNSVKHVSGVPRCAECRAAFFVDFSRYVRRSARSGAGLRIDPPLAMF